MELFSFVIGSLLVVTGGLTLLLLDLTIHVISMVITLFFAGVALFVITAVVRGQIIKHFTPKRRQTLRTQWFTFQLVLLLVFPTRSRVGCFLPLHLLFHCALRRMKSMGK